MDLLHGQIKLVKYILMGCMHLNISIGLVCVDFICFQLSPASLVVNSEQAHLDSRNNASLRLDNSILN